MKYRKNWIWIAVGLAAALVLVCALPPVFARLWPRLDQARIRLFYLLRPPEAEVFTPGQQGRVDAIVQATMTALSTERVAGEQITATPAPTATSTLKPDEPTPTTAPPTPTSTPLPSTGQIENVPYVDQHFGQNECAPATMAMMLKFWGWQGTREELSKAVKPFLRDKNVMPYELVDYANQQTDYRALARFGGTHELLKALISAGFPVMVERGVYLRDLSGKVSWMGHYQVVYGYDDATAIYQVKDAFEENGDRFRVSYEDLIRGWRSFNYAFVVVYPPEQEADVLRTLGSYADEETANRLAYEIASQEVYTTEGQDLFFAWYNRGSSQVQLRDYTGAAQSYDQAFAIYAELPAEQRPWRTTWYQTGPYFAYYYSGRYEDVLALADTTIKAASDPFLEENFYWRARAKEALGDREGAIADLRKSLEYHPGFTPAEEALKNLGVNP